MSLRDADAASEGMDLVGDAAMISEPLVDSTLAEEAAQFVGPVLDTVVVGGHRLRDRALIAPPRDPYVDAVVVATAAALETEEEESELLEEIADVAARVAGTPKEAAVRAVIDGTSVTNLRDLLAARAAVLMAAGEDVGAPEEDADMSELTPSDDSRTVRDDADDDVEWDDDDEEEVEEAEGEGGAAVGEKDEEEDDEEADDEEAARQPPGVDTDDGEAEEDDDDDDEDHEDDEEDEATPRGLGNA